MTCTKCNDGIVIDSQTLHPDFCDCKVGQQRKQAIQETAREGLNVIQRIVNILKGGE